MRTVTSLDRAGALHLTEVDGVRTIWAEVPGPLRAGLVLRMGAADETLARRGAGHLLEHLALFGIERPGEHRRARKELRDEWDDVE